MCFSANAQHQTSVSWDTELPACRTVDHMPRVTLEAVAGQSLNISCPWALTRKQFPSKSIDAGTQSKGQPPLPP